MSKSTHSLTVLELYANRISSLKHVIECLRKCTTIQSLHLQQGSNTNPVCEISAYRPNVISQFPWLQSLDGFDKHDNRFEDAEFVPDIAGKYIEGSRTKILQYFHRSRKEKNSLEGQRPPVAFCQFRRQRLKNTVRLEVQ